MAWEESAETPVGYLMVNVRDIESHAGDVWGRLAPGLRDKTHA